VAHGSIVFTKDLTNWEEEVNYTLEELLPAVGNLRSFFPVGGKKMTVFSGG
jgi:hypothetical protein